jgi:hypothetical protein
LLIDLIPLGIARTAGAWDQADRTFQAEVTAPVCAAPQGDAPRERNWLAARIYDPR